jgi:DNA polymerase-4
MTVAELSNVWGSKVHGERWYYRLRGEDVLEAPTKRRTVGHSHVLPPELRTPAGAHGVLSKLVHKAAARIRSIDYWAGALEVGMLYRDRGRWEAKCKLAVCQDTLSILRAAGELWAGRPARVGPPLQVWMVLYDLVPSQVVTPSLFECDRRMNELSHVMDAVNRKFGKNSLRFGTVCGSEEAAPTRIAFNQIPRFDGELE